MAVGFALAGMPCPLTAEVVRPRLAAVLDERWRVPITLVVAGAGFGKSTTLAQSVRTNQLHPRGFDAWVACQPGDEDPSRFAARVLAALGTTLPSDGDATDAVLRALAERAPTDICVIVDDVHVVGTSSGAARVLGAVAERLPPHAHLVVAGRQLPPLRLARLRAAGAVLELTADDLRFDDVEVGALAAQLAAPSERAQRVAGWPALVRLALTAPPATTLDFVHEEVIAGLDADTRVAVAALAALGDADEATLEQVLGRPVDTVALAARVPLVDVLGDGRVRAHDLWNAAAARYLPAGDLDAVRRRAIDVLAAGGELSRAGALATTVGAWDRLETLATALVRTTVSALPVDTARRWLDAVPAAELGRPGIVLLEAARRQRLCSADPTVDGLIDAVGQHAADAGDTATAVTALGLGVIAAHARADLDRLVTLAVRAETFPLESDPIVGVLVHGMRGVVHELGGDPEAAIAEFEQAPTALVPAVFGLSVNRYHVHCLLMAGRAGEAAALADATLADVADAHTRRIPAMVRFAAGDPAPLLARLDGGTDDESPACGRDAFIERALGAIGAAFLGRAAGRGETIDPSRHDNPRDIALATLASAAAAVQAHDEPTAAALIAACVDRLPVADRLGERHLRRALSLGYVLDERLRARWDAEPLGPAHERVRRVAAAFVAARRGKPFDVDQLDVDAMLCSLPLSWSVELAARIPVERTAGRLIAGLADRVGPVVHDELRWLADQRGTVAASAARLLLAQPCPPVATTRIEVLGPLRVRRDGVALDAPELRRRRVRQLLTLLVLRERVRRDRAIDLLWPDHGPRDGQRNLRVTLSHLRRLLEPDRLPGEASYHLRSEGDHLQLVRSPALQCDLWEFDGLLAAAARDPSPGARAERLAAAVDLVGDDPLRDADELGDAEAEVQRVAAGFVDAAMTLGELQFAAGERRLAAASADRVLGVAPFEERAHRLALAAAVQAGDVAGAGRAAARLCAALDDLGVAPEPETAIALRHATDLAAAARALPVSRVA